MAQDVNLSASIRTNLLSLQRTNELFERTSERLSTGLKVNSALDGTSAFFSAKSLNNRASDLAALKDLLIRQKQLLYKQRKLLLRYLKLRVLLQHRLQMKLPRW